MHKFHKGLQSVVLQEKKPKPGKTFAKSQMHRKTDIPRFVKAAATSRGQTRTIFHIFHRRLDFLQKAKKNSRLDFPPENSYKLPPRRKLTLQLKRTSLLPSPPPIRREITFLFSTYGKREDTVSMKEGGGERQMAKSEEEGRGERGKALTGCISGHPFSFLLFSPPPSSYSLLYEAPAAVACPAVAMMFIAVSRTQHRRVRN